MIKLLKNKIILLFNYFNSILGLFLFLFLSFLLIPVFSLIEIFLKKSKRRMLWRKGARFCLGFYFTFNRLKFNVKNFYNIKQGEAKIYISNHFSPLDGMFLFYILGDNSTLLTAPFGTFDLPFSFWFRKMGCIDVWRNEIEKIKFKSANDPGEAIRKALRELESGQSIILFPEGHISIFFELLYFHSGVARIAIASGKVVIPIAITDVEKVFVKEALVLPGEISFTFGNPMDIKEYYIKNMPTMKNVVEKIRSQMKRMLPKRYKTKEDYTKKTIAVFIDIDGALDIHIAQKKFMRYFYEDLGVIIKAWYHYFLGNLNKENPYALTEFSATFFQGFKAEKLYLKAKKAFDKELKFDLNEGMKILIRDHQYRGHKIILITEMIAPLAKCFADYVGADFYLATNLEEKNMRCTGRLIDWYKDKDHNLEKIKVLTKQYHFKLADSFGYGHSKKDLTWLKLMGHKILINPENGLKKFAKTHKYRIIIN